MTLAVLQCPKIFDVLSRFYTAMHQPPPVDVVMVPAEEVPPPYFGLLVHGNDMTSTLQRHHGETLRLRVLERAEASGQLSRHIVLEGQRTGRPVEYGAIRIEMAPLDEEARRRVREGREPLGGILNSQGIPYSCCPGGFFRIRAGALMCRVLKLDRADWLYGRCNCLYGEAGQIIAEVVEILPPEEAPSP